MKQLEKMERFNKYQFVADLEVELLEAVASDQLKSTDQVWDWIHQSIDCAVIYYADCFDIVRELGFTDWEHAEFAPITNISQAAYAALYEHVNENIDLTEVEQAIENKVEND